MFSVDISEGKGQATLQILSKILVYFFFIEVLKIMSPCKSTKYILLLGPESWQSEKKVFAPKTVDLSWNPGHPHDWRRKQAPSSYTLTYIGKLWHVFTCTLMHKHTHTQLTKEMQWIFRGSQEIYLLSSYIMYYHMLVRFLLTWYYHMLTKCR